MKAAAALVLAAALLVPAGAAAQTPGSAGSRDALSDQPPARAASASQDPNALVTPASQTEPPPGHVLSARGAIAIANQQKKIREERDKRGDRMKPRAFQKGSSRWQVSYYDGKKEVGQVLIDDRSAAVLETWTGPQVAWSMARGYPGAFGRRVNAWYVWIPLCVLFVAPFVDPRRPFRLLHLDLLVLVSFSVSLAFFNHGNIDASVPLAVPPMLYLLVRMLLAAFRPRPPDPARGPKLLVPASWLVVAIVFLVGFRVGLNIANGNVIDVGYSGVIGADKLMDGEPLYGDYPKDNQHGDTYGPVNAYAYAPAEQALPWSGRWDDLPAAHASSIAFDLLTLLGLWLVGRRIRGPTLGVALAYAWVTWPFTIYASSSGSNDSLVALTVVAVFLVISRPVARGAAAAVAGLTKFAPLALAPLLATYDHANSRRTLRPRVVLAFALGFLVMGAILMLPVLLRGDLRLFYDRTLGYQSSRGSPFSLWGLWDLPQAAQSTWKAGAAGLALFVALFPKRRDVRVLAALAAAVMIAFELSITHWFYLYLVWFFPLVLIVLLAPPPPLPAPAAPPEPAAAEPERVPAPA
jgi:hypothetical protein